MKNIDKKVLNILKNKTKIVEKIIKESVIEKTVCDYAISKGWLCYKFTSPSNRAVPDRIFIRNSIVLMIEFKAFGKNLTKLQLKIAGEIQSEGIRVFKCNTIEKGKLIFNHFEKSKAK